MIPVLAIPDAVSGEKILPAYNALARVVRSWGWFGGDGVSITETPMGTIVKRMPEGRLWLHPWRVTLGGSAISVAPGVVNSAMPHMAGRRMDGLDDAGEPDDRGVPHLNLDMGLFDESNLAWVVLRVHAGEQRVITRPAEIVQTDKHTWGGGYAVAQKEEGGTYGDCPLAMLRKGKDDSVRALQVAHFNLRCRVQPDKFWFMV